jgi:hypothetical protein
MRPHYDWLKNGLKPACFRIHLVGATNLRLPFKTPIYWSRRSTTVPSKRTLQLHLLRHVELLLGPIEHSQAHQCYS